MFCASVSLCVKGTVLCLIKVLLRASNEQMSTHTHTHIRRDLARSAHLYGFRTSVVISSRKMGITTSTFRCVVRM